MNEIRIGIRELKNKLTEYLRRVKAGETIIVTEYGRSIAQITPIRPTLEERLQALAEVGLVDWNGQKLKPYQPKAVNEAERQLSDLIIEDRE